MNLGVKDNLGNKSVTVCFGKGEKSRYLPLAEAAISEITAVVLCAKSSQKRVRAMLRQYFLANWNSAKTNLVL